MRLEYPLREDLTLLHLAGEPPFLGSAPGFLHLNLPDPFLNALPAHCLGLTELFALLLDSYFVY